MQQQSRPRFECLAEGALLPVGFEPSEWRVSAEAAVEGQASERLALVDCRHKRTLHRGTILSFAPLIPNGGSRQLPSLKGVGPALAGSWQWPGRYRLSQRHATILPLRCARARYDRIAGEPGVAIADNSVKWTRSSFRATARM
jgi:hypothetical protein